MMALKGLFPIVVTAKLADARNFYVQHLGFPVVFEADWFVQLHASRGDGLPAAPEYAAAYSADEETER